MGVIIKNAEYWLSENPILIENDYGFVSETGEYRIGDGENVWSELKYPEWNDVLSPRLTDDFTRNYLNELSQTSINGGVAIKIVEFDYSILVNDNSIFANCSGEDLEITLPDPSDMLYTFNGQTYSKEIQVTKSDSTLFKVKVLPFGMSKILGEDFQYLESQYDNITLISDGINYFER